MVKMTKKRERLILWIVLEIVFIALVFVGSVYDFNISYALSGVSAEGGVLKSNVSFIAKALEVIGEWPAIIFASFASCVIVRNIKKIVKKSTPALVFVIFFDLAVIVLMFRGWLVTFKDIFGTVKGWYYAIIIPLSLVFAFLMRFAVSKIRKETVKSFFIPAVVTVITAAVILVCLEAIKISWGRVRMREIVAANDVSLFTSWYVPNWFSGSKSFPSGHMAHSTLLFLLPIWFPKKYGEKARRLAYIGVGAWVLILGFSRICAAAHYLTDVTFGFALSFIIVQIATVKFEDSLRQRPVPKFIKTTEMTARDAMAATSASSARQAATLTDTQKPAPQKEEVSKQTQSVRVQTDATPKPTEKTNAKPELKPAPIAQKPVHQTPPAPEKKTVQQSAPVQKPAQPAQHQSAPQRTIPSQKPILVPTEEQINSATPPTLTSFSLDKARAEKAEREAQHAAHTAAEAKKLDDNLKLAVTAEIKDISVPVVPKAKSQPKSQKRRPTTKKPSQKKKAAPQSDTAVQMHFKYDNESNNLTSDISDD